MVHENVIAGVAKRLVHTPSKEDLQKPSDPNASITFSTCLAEERRAFRLLAPAVYHRRFKGSAGDRDHYVLGYCRSAFMFFPCAVSDE
ncbi:hypothetical protein NDU88_006903 [Pleurodeles waltl]|uniref:Uncharacterized protein n=1 Tax=Pleurodeles waltl TaxID=8319 RepID=A0AAV7P0R3_PLEWA|nr:hypothetical protein NDU88_006903 [Pleurodeles waltl]